VVYIPCICKRETCKEEQKMKGELGWEEWKLVCRVQQRESERKVVGKTDRNSREAQKGEAKQRKAQHRETQQRK
jgi:hypothetical protein